MRYAPWRNLRYRTTPPNLIATQLSQTIFYNYPDEYQSLRDYDVVNNTLLATLHNEPRAR